MSVFCVGGERERKGERSGWIGLREFVQASIRLRWAAKQASGQPQCEHGSTAIARMHAELDVVSTRRAR